MTTRLKPADRTEQLLAAALRLASKHGLANITRAQIAEYAEVAPSLVSARLGTMEALRRSVMRAAVAQEVLPVIAEGVATRNKYALKAAPSLIERALGSLR